MLQVCHQIKWTNDKELFPALTTSKAALSLTSIETYINHLPKLGSKEVVRLSHDYRVAGKGSSWKDQAWRLEEVYSSGRQERVVAL